MITFILLFACLQVYGASASLEDKGSSPYAETEELWWSQTQKLIDDERGALTACVHAKIDGRTYDYASTVEEIQQFVKPIIDILQQIHKEGLDSGGWPDLQTAASYYTDYSNLFDEIRISLDPALQVYGDFADLFWYFLECVDACCKKDQFLAVSKYANFMRLVFNTPKEYEKQSQVTRIYSLHASRAERESIVANCVPDTQKCTHTIEAYFSPSELMKNHERILQNGEED